MLALVCQEVMAPNEGPKPLFEVTIDHDFPNPDESFKEVMELLLDNYYTTQLRDKDLYWAAIQGMLRHVSPPEHPELAAIWPPGQYEQILNSLKGVATSIGIKSSFNSTEGSLTVTEVTQGSPSDGRLKPLYRILRIDGKILKGLSVKCPTRCT